MQNGKCKNKVNSFLSSLIFLRLSTKNFYLFQTVFVKNHSYHKYYEEKVKTAVKKELDKYRKEIEKHFADYQLIRTKGVLHSNNQSKISDHILQYDFFNRKEEKKSDQFYEKRILECFYNVLFSDLIVKEVESNLISIFVFENIYSELWLLRHSLKVPFLIAVCFEYYKKHHLVVG